MIVDQLGQGPRMVLRYPTTADSSSSSSSSSSAQGDGDDLFYRLPGRQMAKLFRPKPSLCGQPMTLSVGGTVFCCCAVLMDEQQQQQQQQQQQLDETLSAGSSTPLDVTSTASSTTDHAASTAASTATATATTAAFSKDHLVLFSVIVALAPPLRTSSLPFGSWMEPEPHHPTGTQTNVSSTLPPSPPSRMPWKPSATFLCVRRVHVSLARLCRVLEREERRCRYVSTQANRFSQIRHDLVSGDHQHHPSSNVTYQSPPHKDSTNDTVESTKRVKNENDQSGTTGGITVPSVLPLDATHVQATSHMPIPLTFSTQTKSTTPTTVSPSQPTVNSGTPSRLNHRQSGSFSMSYDRDMVVSSTGTEDHMPLHLGARTPLHQDVEQEILETILASPPTRTKLSKYDMEVVHHGNLARELLQVYHALARNDQRDGQLEQTPTNLLSGRDNVVYINRHLAVVIEAVTASPDRQHSSHESLEGRPVARIRPYQTLYFPTVSPDQLLASMAPVATSTTASNRTMVAPRRLPLLLQNINPQRSLSDIALNAGMSLQATMELASNLVVQGVCLALPIVSRSMRLACRDMTAIRQATLPFAQTFGSSVHLFVLVSVLTNTERNLGETMTWLANSTHGQAVRLREGLQVASPFEARYDNDKDQRRPTGSLHHPTLSEEEAQIADLEDQVYQMVVWLCSHRVLVQLQEYLVSIVDPETRRKKYYQGAAESGHQQLPLGDYPHSERKSDSHGKFDSLTDGALYKVLWESACLTGKVSTSACCWKLGIEISKLFAFLSRNECIQRVTRVPVVGDDWGVHVGNR